MTMTTYRSVQEKLNFNFPHVVFIYFPFFFFKDEEAILEC